MTVRSSVFLLIALTLLVCALSTGAQIYYLLLLCMAMMLLLGLVSVAAALLTVQVSMEMPRRKLTRGLGAPITVRVRYIGLLPVRSFRLALLVPEDERAEERMDIQLLPLVQKQFQYELPCPHRGVYHVGVSSVGVSDIFNLFSLRRKIPDQQVLLEVRPRATQLPPMELRSGESEPEVLTRMTEDQASPSDVRNYLRGDPLKKIHWKLSIRKRELLVRTYEESSRPDTLILVDLSPLSLMRSQALTIEDMITETAASIALAQLRAGYPVRMPLMSQNPQEASGKSEQDSARFMDALMRVRFDSPYPYEQVLTLEMRRMQRTGGAVLVTARLTPRTCDIAAQLKRYGMQVCVCWVTDTRRIEALEMLERLTLMGIQAHRIDPFDRGLNEESLFQTVMDV